MNASNVEPKERRQLEALIEKYGFAHIVNELDDILYEKTRYAPRRQTTILHDAKTALREWEAQG